jgi:hypothetical protein
MVRKLGQSNARTEHVARPRFSKPAASSFSARLLTHIRLKVCRFDTTIQPILTPDYFNASELQAGGALTGLQRATAFSGSATEKWPGQRAGSLPG